MVLGHDHLHGSSSPCDRVRHRCWRARSHASACAEHLSPAAVAARAAVLSRPRPGGAAEVVRGPALPAALEFWVQFPFARHHSGIAAASSILAGWLAQRPHICVTGSATANTSKITAPGPQAYWSTASPQVRTRVLDQDCKCVEAPPDVAPNAAGADNAQACAAAPLSLPPQNLLARQHDLSEESQRSFVKL